MVARPSRVFVVGPLAPHVAGFRSELALQGYRPLALTCQLRVLAHLSRWMAGQGLEPAGLDTERIEQFLEARRAEGYTLWTSPKGVEPLVRYLRSCEIVPPASVPPPSAVDLLVDEFRVYLLNERGIAPSSTTSYLHVARLFIHALPGDGGLRELTAVEVLGFIAEQCEVHNPAYIACGVRSFLRFCHLRGLTSTPLAGAVPRVANRRRSKLPVSVDAATIKKLLQSCDRQGTGARPHDTHRKPGRSLSTARQPPRLPRGAVIMRTRQARPPPIFVPLGPHST